MRHSYIHQDSRSDHYAVGRNAHYEVLVQVGDRMGNQARGHFVPSDAQNLAVALKRVIDGSLHSISTSMWAIERHGGDIRLGIQDSETHATVYVGMPAGQAAACADELVTISGEINRVTAGLLKSNAA